MPAPTTASRARLDRHWDVLCHEIGNRYAGTPGEQKAADYIEDQFRRSGLSNVEQQVFEFPNWNYSRCALRVGKTRPTRRIATARPMVYSTGTPTRGVRGRVAYLQAGMPLDFASPLKGKIGLLVGSLLLGDKKFTQRVVQSGLKALLAVDSRMYSDWTTSNGAAPQWVDGYDVPTCGLSYRDAVRIVEEADKGPLNAHLTIDARSFPADSENVVGEIPGTDHPNEVIVVSGHHDSVWGIVGADDNGSGVVFVLEMARLFARQRPRRTIRFISYGVEERLSVGSYLYMRSLNPRERNRIVFAINTDSGGSAVGTDVVLVTGPPALEKLVNRTWARRKHPAVVSRGQTPYSDQFPLNIAGIPSIYLGRPSIGTAGHWSLHSVHDNVDRVSSAVLGRTIDSAAALLHKVANAPRLPFPRKIGAALARKVREVARREYRHPWSPDKFDYHR